MEARHIARIAFSLQEVPLPMWYNGFLDLPVWQLIIVTLVLTHITIVAVTVYLHRYSAHRSLELNPALKHFFRFWLWMTTGMNTASGRPSIASTTPNVKPPTTRTAR